MQKNVKELSENLIKLKCNFFYVTKDLCAFLVSKKEKLLLKKFVNKLFVNF